MGGEAVLTKLLVAVSILAAGVVASGEITDVQMVPVYQGIIGDPATPEMWVDVHDLVVTIAGNDAWTVAGGAAVGVPWATCDAYGLFFQHAKGGTCQPNLLWFHFFPAVEWDTFYATHLGWPNVETQGVLPGFAYGPIEDNIPSTELMADWYSTPDFNYYPGTFTIARVTIAPDDPENWWVDIAVQVGSLETTPLLFETTYGIPEPGSLALLALGGLALFRRRPPQRVQPGTSRRFSSLLHAGR